MIIDAHVHIGHDTTFDSNRKEDEVISKMDEVGINAAIVQPAQFVTFEEYRDCHDRIYAFSKKYPNRIFGMFSMNPHFDLQKYKSEAHRCVKELGFVGMKVTPLTHAWNPLVKRGRVPFETARELNIPLMCHLGIGLPFSLASALFYLIREFSDVTVILAHCGTLDNEDECLLLAKEFPNVYLETSVRTSNQKNLKKFIKEIGSNRVMYASDSPDEMAHCAWQVRNCGFSKEQVEDILWRTAANAFKIADKL